MNQVNNIAVKESAHINAFMDQGERLPFHGYFTLEKFRVNEETGLSEVDPFDVLTFPNLAVNVGGALMLDLFIGGGGTVFSNANANIGIGDSLTAAAVGQTDLQAATNKLRKAMDATFPSRAAQVMTFKSTFASADANYAWNEIALFNAAAAGSMFLSGAGYIPVHENGGIVDNRYIRAYVPIGDYMKDSKKKDFKEGDAVTIKATVIATDRHSVTVQIGDGGHMVTLTKDQADALTAGK